MISVSFKEYSRGRARRTNLLSNHDGPRGECRATNTWNGEELDEASEVVGMTDDVGLFDKLGVDIVKIASGLERGVAKPKQRAVGGGVAALLHKPSGRLWTEVDS